MRLNRYIQSFRLRTLLLSMAGIMLGSILALRFLETAGQDGTFSLLTFFLSLVTAVNLQILSNLSNELGDAQHGTDADQHARVAYGLQAGTITEREMRRMIAVFVGVCAVCGTALVWSSFGTLFAWQPLLFLALGAFAIVGAMTYTLGRHNYGYLGFGDLGVFIFFGLLSTMGSFYLQTHTLTMEVFWAAVAIGLPIVGVLNVNNIRDMDNDRLHGKHTFAGLLGKTGGKIYQVCLLVGCLTIFCLLGYYYTLLLLPVFAWHVWYIFTHSGSRLDLQMPVLMASSLMLSLLAAL